MSDNMFDERSSFDPVDLNKGGLPNTVRALAPEILDRFIRVTLDMQYRDLLTGAIDSYRGMSPKDLMEDVGKFCHNNGMTAFVDHEGVLYAGPSTTALRQALIDAGYRQGGLFVPFSNGEIPADQALQDKFIKLWQQAKAENKAARKEEMMRAYYKRGTELKIKQPVGEWLLTDSLSYILPGSLAGNIRHYEDSFGDGMNMPSGRLEAVGTYCSNNGVLAFVDYQGRVFIGFNSDERRDALKEAGYRPGSFFVPFSNGEWPVDPEVQQHFRDWFGLR